MAKRRRFFHWIKDTFHAKMHPWCFFLFGVSFSFSFSFSLFSLSHIIHLVLVTTISLESNCIWEREKELKTLQLHSKAVVLIYCPIQLVQMYTSLRSSRVSFSLVDTSLLVYSARVQFMLKHGHNCRCQGTFSRVAYLQIH